MSAPLDAAGVADALGISYDLFMRTRRDLEARGFPRPLPLASRPQSQAEREKFPRTRGRPPLRWDADTVEAWKRNPMPETTPRAALQRRASADQARMKERMG